MKALVLLTVIAPLTAPPGAAWSAEAAQTRWHLAVERAGLSTALAQLAQQVGVDLARFSDVDSGEVVVGPLKGDFSRDEALERLLRGTGLTYQFVNAQTVAIVQAPCVDPASSVVAAPVGKPGATGTPSVVQSKAEGAAANEGTSAAIRQATGQTAAGSRLWSWVKGIFTGDKAGAAGPGASAKAGVVALCGAMALTAHSSARAQSPQVEDTSGLVSLEEVIVTAQRREENAQKVPISIDIVTAAEAAARGATSIQTLSATIPNLTNTGNFYSHTYIRGVGANNGSPNNEPSAATYIDGVYIPSSFGLFGNFNNIERIEVLKGPQGTLFGRNTTGGVVQIITADPKREFGGELDLSYGNYNTFNTKAYVTGGLTSNLAADLAIIYENQGTGWGRNLTRNTEIYKHRNVAARSKWLYTPSDATKVTVSLDYVAFDFSGGFGMLPGSVNPADNLTTYAGRFNAYGDPTDDHAEQHGAAVRVDHVFAGVHLTSISSYRHVAGFEFHDNDRVAARRSYIQASNASDYGMQELQLSNREPGRLTWLVGAFLYGNLVDANDPRIESGTTVTPGQYREVYGRQKTRSYSLYGQGTRSLTDSTKLTLGLRYTTEQLTEDGKYLNAAKQLINASPFNSTLKFTPWTWRVALDHEFADDVLGYVSYNHGFKSGGYNLPTPERAPFMPETLDAYEAGVKSELLQRRLRFNAAAFYYDYRDIQVVIVPGNAGQIFTNAAAARNFGLDASLEFAVTTRLTLTAGVGLLDAKYTDYPNAQGFTANGVAINLANAAGRSLPYAPPFSGFVSGTFRVPTAMGEFRASLNVAYNERSYISPVEVPVVSAYYNVGSALEWRSTAMKPLAVRLWGRNLANAYIPSGTISSSGGWYAAYTAPRTFGLTLIRNF